MGWTKRCVQVPNSWHVINDQDAVAHGMKLGGLYKRNGHRVMLLGRGNLIVRPTHFELSMFKVPTASHQLAKAGMLLAFTETGNCTSITEHQCLVHGRPCTGRLHMPLSRLRAYDARSGRRSCNMTAAASCADGMPRLQTPCRSSLSHHTMRAYHHALLEIVKKRLDSDNHRCAEGQEDLMQLLKVLCVPSLLESLERRREWNQRTILATTSVLFRLH